MVIQKISPAIKKVYEDRFKRYLIFVLLILGIVLIVQNFQSSQGDAGMDEWKVHFFYSPTCPHCAEQKPFNEILKQKYPMVEFVYHDVSNPNEVKLFLDFADKQNIPRVTLGVPLTVFGNSYVLGFDKAETTGKEIEKKLMDFANKTKKENSIEKAKNFTGKIKLPIIGEINTLNYSLPVLAVILGLVDGFNPCAMWVLVYLISLILSINDRKKIWLLVGSFVFASGVLYFLFMTAWLNVFLLIGYIRPLTIIIGLFALGMGISDLRTYFGTRGAIECEIMDIGSKKKTMSKIQQIVESPITWATTLGIIGLAFVVNSIEFVCSSALPAIFTQVLALSELSGLKYYSYILLYDIFFMFDDMIIFGLAAFAASSNFGHKYAKQCKLIGGIVLVLLGVLLAFAPELLNTIG